MVDVQQVLLAILTLMRLLLFGMALGITVISYQAYSQRRTDRLQYAFIGFAFIAMGVAFTNLNTQLGDVGGATFAAMQIVETVPFIIGFGMIYLSLYR